MKEHLINFKKYIVQNKLVQKNDAILIAVSGGIDSISMLNLFLKIKDEFNLKLGVIHINHTLRGDESDLDELFVKNIAEKNNLTFFTQKFDTKNYSVQNKIGIQEAARKLRYKYFNEVLKNSKFRKIATAHNFNDNAETIFLNLIRGTGINGLCGIPIKRKNIIRPILFLKRKDIFNYAKNNNIVWREDKSNASNKYKRNLIRNKIFPQIEKQFDISTALNNISVKAIELQSYFKNKIGKIYSEIVSTEKNLIVIDLKKINSTEKILHDFLFYELLKKMNVNPTSEKINKIEMAISSQAGRKYEIGDGFIAQKNNQKLLIYKDENKYEEIVEISEFGKFNFGDYQIEIKKVNSANFKKSKNIEFVDSEKIKFPLKIRNWQINDYFCPIGLNGKKKLSDFFIDNKLSSIEKEKIPILFSDEKIIWVVGLRIDERFKISPNTKKILKLTVKKI